MVIGRIAASLLGKPRLTAVVGAVVLFPVEELPRLIEVAGSVGLVPRIKNAEDFARKHRVLLLRHQESGINVDLSLALLPFEVEAVERSVPLQVGSISVRVPTVEDPIIFKAVAHRPKDLIDIQALVDIHPRLDRDRTERWVREFARALEMPELWSDIEAWLR